MKIFKGFTLIELLIVIAIIGILAVALLPRIAGAPGKARDAQRQTAIQTISSAVESYAADHAGLYPLSATLDCFDPDDTVVTDPSLLVTPYLRGGLPTDPTATKLNNTCEGQYFYQSNAAASQYVVGACLESGTAADRSVCVGDTDLAIFCDTDIPAADDCP